MTKLGYTGVIEQEYDKITRREEVTRNAQTTINSLCDYAREVITGSMEEFTGDSNAIYIMATTNISSFLLRKGNQMLNGMFAPLKRDGVTKMYELGWGS